MSAEPLVLDPELIDAVERASLEGWAPTVLSELSDGWILRATPGLDRGRSNNALTPRHRALTDGELALALERVRAWSALHGVRAGLQVSPLELHASIVPGLLARGWQPGPPVRVMVADRSDALARGSAFREPAGEACPLWTCTRTPEPAWLDAWAACRESREGVDVHVATVFDNIGARGRFGRLGEVATGIAAEDLAGEWAGLFSLVVAPNQRGRGLGRRLVIELLASVDTPRVYLQVEAPNPVALGLYESFGFRTIHSYQHLYAPAGWATG